MNIACLCGVWKSGIAPPLPSLRFCANAYYFLRFRTLDGSVQALGANFALAARRIDSVGFLDCRFRRSFMATFDRPTKYQRSGTWIASSFVLWSLVLLVDVNEPVRQLDVMKMPECFKFFFFDLADSGHEQALRKSCL